MSDFRRIVSQCVGLPVTASDEELARGLAEMIRPKVEYQQLSEPPKTPAKSFTDLVGEKIAAENLSYGEAASRVSMERPDLYAIHCQEASYN